ncbi:MAG: hypothetical protein MPK09_03370 [Gammaproteobacteria bacterium]|nr:hypothetical protein [Gammaproteobacteria bacterium]
MQPEELAGKLRGMYDNAPEGEKTTMIHLFGVLYADELKNCGAPVAEIAKNSVGDAYHTEISKGIRLARYVELKAQHQGEF